MAGQGARITGWVLSGLLAAAFIMSATFKLMGAAEVQEVAAKWGLTEWMTIIGIGELVSAVIFLIPRTLVPGTLLLSSYLGGAIVTHMQNDEPFVGAAVFLVVVWIAAVLRAPELLWRLRGSKESQVRASNS